MDQQEIIKITNYIFLDSEPQKADLGLVFGTRHQEAVNKAYELYRDKFIPKILVSGGINKITGENEAFEMSRKLIEIGVREEDVIMEDQSTNSLENVLFSKRIIEKKFGLDNIKKIIIITKHYHARRAMMTLKKHFPGHIEFIPAIYEICGFKKDNWFNSEIGKEKIMSEWSKIQEYLKKGDIEEIG